MISTHKWFLKTQAAFPTYKTGIMAKTNNALRKLFITIVLISLHSVIYAESPYRKVIYNSFVNRQMYKWEAVLRTMDAVNEPTSIEQKLEHIDYYYGYIAHLIGKKQFNEADEELIKANRLVDNLIKISPKNATAYAYKGAFIGLKIATNRLKSVYLKPESNAYINKALELDPQNSQAHIDKGNMLFYAPRIIGGDKKNALNYYLRAMQLIEKNKDTNQNWRYLNLLTIIGIAYEKIDMLAEAKLAYEKALRKEPNYKWVKDDLYPNLLAKIKNQ